MISSMYVDHEDPAASEAEQRARLDSRLEDLLQDARSGIRKLASRSAQNSTLSHTREECAVRRGMIRFMVIIIDCSENMNQRDMRPTRLAVTHQVVSTYIQDFFDQNPISQIALIELREGKAERISELSGNARRHQQQLDARLIAECKGLGKGVPSLRAGLEQALRILELQASYGTREVLAVYGSLSTCDRGDIFDTVARLRSGGVRVNIVGMAAELFIARTACKETGGRYDVATHADELRRAALRHTSPPPTPAELGDRPAAGMWVGFPHRVREPLPGWQCPRCHSVYPHVPVDCSLCGLKLLSAVHLARSYHHLFPVPPFRMEPAQPGATCAACGEPLVDAGGEEEAAAAAPDETGGEGCYRCPRCGGGYCSTCDGFIHEALHVCPGCETRDVDAAAAAAPTVLEASRTVAVRV